MNIRGIDVIAFAVLSSAAGAASAQTPGLPSLPKSPQPITTPQKAASAAGAFEGIVVDWKGNPVADAKVDINQTITQTDSEGHFKMFAEPDGSRYVFNIRKPGHALFGRIYDRPMDNMVWELAPATVVVADPTQPIDASAPMRPETCRGALSSRIAWSNFTDQHAPVTVGPGGTVSPVTLPPDLEAAVKLVESGTLCSPGFRVQIPANSLVDENGAPPPGDVEITISTVDLYAPNGMPGNLTVATGDDTGVMESFGAGTIDIYDANGNEYNLRPGTKAQLTIPVDPQHLSFGGVVPPTIPLIVYNEVTGRWDIEGTLVLNGKGDAYEANVPHFSAWNADLVKVNQSCIRIESPQIPYDYDLEIIIPMPGRPPVTLTRLIDNTSDTIHTYYNLPSGQDVQLRPFRRTQAGPIPLGSFMVNTGAPQVPTRPNEPAYPYNACQSAIELIPQGATLILDNSRHRYDLRYAEINGQAVSLPNGAITPGASAAVSVPGLRGGDLVNFYIEWGPQFVGSLYATTDGGYASPGVNTISPIPPTIGDIMTLFQPTRRWFGVFAGGTAAMDYDRFGNWTLSSAGQTIFTGSTQAVVWNNNAPNITINVGVACNNQNVVLINPFNPSFAQYICNVPAQGGGTVSVRFDRQ